MRSATTEPESRRGAIGVSEQAAHAAHVLATRSRGERDTGQPKGAPCRTGRHSFRPCGLPAREVLSSDSVCAVKHKYTDGVTHVKGAAQTPQLLVVQLRLLA
jgi:hypothetical protein